jgi:hypothetical protein
MRPLILTALIAMTSTAHAECLSSAGAVWNTHPGSHATWRLRLPGHEGTKCWFARGRKIVQAPRVRQVVDSQRARDAERRTDGNESPARLESQRTSPPGGRGPSSMGHAHADRPDLGRPLRQAGARRRVMPLSRARGVTARHQQAAPRKEPTLGWRSGYPSRVIAVVPAPLVSL